MPDRYAAIRRVFLVAMCVNLFVAAVVGGYGLASGSLGMQADGSHALLHALGGLIGIVGVTLAARPPDPSHPYGYERYEPLAAVGTVAVMLLAIREILAAALARLGSGSVPTVDPLSFASVGLAAVAAIGLGFWMRRRGRELESTALVAESRRTFADVLVALSVGAGLLAALMGAPLVDAVVALGIAGTIAWTGWTMLRDVSAILTDAATADVDRIARAAHAVEGVQGVHRVRARGSAGAVRVDLHISVDPEMPMARAHDLTHRVRDRVREEIGGIAEVLIHVGVAPEPQHDPED